MEGRSVPVSGDKSEGPHPGSALECRICSKPPTDPVATSCGHVFCWPCVFSLVGNKRKRKPCPVCGTFLTRDMNILPLYCGGAGAIMEVPRAPSQNGIPPPRPRNPQMFVPWFARVGGSNKGGLDLVARIEGSNKDGLDLDTPRSVSVLGQIEQEINNERARNRRMVDEFKREEDRMIDDNVRVELTRMERKLMREKSQMVLDIARLEGQLARATQLLPNGWGGLTVVD